MPKITPREAAAIERLDSIYRELSRLVLDFDQKSQTAGEKALEADQAEGDNQIFYGYHRGQELTYQIAALRIQQLLPFEARTEDFR